MFNTLCFKLLCSLSLPFVTLVSSSVLGYEYVYIKFISHFFYKKDKPIEPTNKEVGGWNLTDLKQNSSEQYVGLKSAITKKTALNTALTNVEQQKIEAKEKFDNLHVQINKVAAEIHDTEKKLIEFKNIITSGQAKKTKLEDRLAFYEEQIKANEELSKAVEANKQKNKRAIDQAKASVKSSNSNEADKLQKVEKQKTEIARKKAAYEAQLKIEEVVKVEKDNADIAFIAANRKHEEQVANAEKTFKDKTQKQTALANLALVLASKESQVDTKKKARDLAVNAKKAGKHACEMAVKKIDPKANCEKDNYTDPKMLIASVPYQVLQGLSDQASREYASLEEEIKKLKDQIQKQTKIKEELTKIWQLPTKDKNKFLPEKNQADQAQKEKSAAYTESVTKTASLQKDYQTEIPKLEQLNVQLSEAQEAKAKQEDLFASLEVEETNIDKELAALKKEAAALLQNKNSDTQQLEVVTKQIGETEKEIAKESKKLEEKLDEQGTNKLLISSTESSLSFYDETIKQNQKSIESMDEFIGDLTAESEQSKKQLIALDTEISKSNNQLFKS